MPGRKIVSLCSGVAVGAGFCRGDRSEPGAPRGAREKAGGAWEEYATGPCREGALGSLLPGVPKIGAILAVNFYMK